MTVDIAVNLRRDNDIERSIDDILGKFTKNAEYTGSVDVMNFVPYSQKSIKTPVIGIKIF